MTGIEIGERMRCAPHTGGQAVRSRNLQPTRGCLYTKSWSRTEASSPSSSRVVRDDIGLHDSVARIICLGQCVRVRRNVSPAILNLGKLAIDRSLVVVDKGVAIPMRGAPQLTTGISGRFEASEKS